MSEIEKEIERLTKQYNEERGKSKPDPKLLLELLMTIFRLKVDLSFLQKSI